MEKKFAVLIDSRIALLIDGENIPAKYVKTIFDELVTEGIPTIKRIYGNWTTNDLAGWKKILLDYALAPIQQFNYTRGKNSTDSAMIIDAMDILYTGNVDGFCIVSSDCDFTKLAMRLREAGKTVIGMGVAQTPSSFVKACSKFKHLDLITNDTAHDPTAKNDDKSAPKSDSPATNKQSNSKNKTDGAAKKKKSKNKSSDKDSVKTVEKPAPVQEPIVAVTQPEPVVEADASKDESSVTPIGEIKEAILKVMEDSDEESGLILASKVGTILQNRFSDFDCRNYGCKKMADLLKKLKIPTVKYDDPNNPIPNAALLYIKVK